MLRTWRRFGHRANLQDALQGVRGTESASPGSQASVHSGIARSVLFVG